MKKIFLIIAVSFFGLIISAQEVRIPGTETRQITSAIVAGQEYQLHIMLPGGYGKSNKFYPVVYLMDSQWDFPLLTGLYGQQYFDGFIPQMIIVGVTWGGMNPNPDSLRARDYTPTHVTGSPQSGGADKFLSFLKEELFPYIETNYRADKHDRTLAGCSLGGLFTMYSLFTQPGLFQRYISSSPAFGWDKEVLYQYENKYAANKSNPSAKLYICFGGVERNLPGFQNFSKHLNDRHYDSLQIQSMVLDNTGHSGTKGEGYARGLQYVFKRPSLQLNNNVLDKFTGRYQLPDGNIAEIKREGNQLFIYTSDTNKFLLHAASSKEFYSISQFLSLKFKFDVNRNITAADIETFGGTVAAKKL